MLVKVAGTSYVRDTKTMALINTDNAGLEEYNFKKELINRQNQEINNIKTEINEIKSDMQVIKSMLTQLASRK
jgi:ABC-type glycerol-3-phosphate transport system substrate-binding protein